MASEVCRLEHKVASVLFAHDRPIFLEDLPPLLFEHVGADLREQYGLETTEDLKAFFEEMPNLCTVERVLGRFVIKARVNGVFSHLYSEEASVPCTALKTENMLTCESLLKELEDLCELKGLGEPSIKVIAKGAKQINYFCLVQVSRWKTSSHPREYSTEEEAKSFALKNMISFLRGEVPTGSVYELKPIHVVKPSVRQSGGTNGDTSEAENDVPRDDTNSGVSRDGANPGASRDGANTGVPRDGAISGVNPGANSGVNPSENSDANSDMHSASVPRTNSISEAVNHDEDFVWGSDSSLAHTDVDTGANARPRVNHTPASITLVPTPPGNPGSAPWFVLPTSTQNSQARVGDNDRPSPRGDSSHHNNTPPCNVQLGFYGITKSESLIRRASKCHFIAMSVEDGSVVVQMEGFYFNQLTRLQYRVRPLTKPVVLGKYYCVEEDGYLFRVIASEIGSNGSVLAYNPDIDGSSDLHQRELFEIINYEEVAAIPPQGVRVHLLDVTEMKYHPDVLRDFYDVVDYESPLYICSVDRRCACTGIPLCDEVPHVYLFDQYFNCLNSVFNTMCISGRLAPLES